MINDTEQHVARCGAHPVDRRAFHNLSVLRREPWNRKRDFAGTLDLGDCLVRNAEVLQPPPSTLHGLTAQ
jgi:hypothetical protein